jgi:predicted nucleic acid-binding protein
MISVLLDTNLLLDVLLHRDPWFADAEALWLANDAGLLRACITATSLTNLFYIVRKASHKAAANRAVDACIDVLTLLPVDAHVIGLARSLNGPDFEDDVQIAAALRWKMEAVITRDPGGFAGATLPVLSPAAARVSLIGGP